MVLAERAVICPNQDFNGLPCKKMLGGGMGGWYQTKCPKCKRIVHLVRENGVDKGYVIG